MVNFTTLQYNRSLLIILTAAFSISAFSQVDHVVISQASAGGGNAGAAFTHDYVELFNPTGATVTLSGKSIQYAGPLGTTWSVHALAGSIGPGEFYLVRMGGGTQGAGAPLDPDEVGSLNMGTVGGKVALVNGTAPLTGSGCPSAANVIDFLGWGTANCAEVTTAPAHANATSTRRTNPCVDTNNNQADFSTANPPTPRNSSTAPIYCYPVQLVITSISPASPLANGEFSVTVEAQNASGAPQGVLQATTIQLGTNGNAGPLGGITTGIIPQGGTSVTINNVSFASTGNNVTVTATATSGQALLQPGTSAPFTVVGSPTTRVQFSIASQTVDEDAGTVTLTVSITDPSATEATSVLVALASGNGALVGGFSSQTLVFPAGSSEPQTITLDLIDDIECSGSEVLSFGLENVTGGQGPAQVGIPSTHTLTITEDDQRTSVQLARQFFDGSGSDDWQILSGGAFISNDPGAGSTPPNQAIISAPGSWQVSNDLATLELGTVFIDNWTDLTLRMRVASLSENPNNGADQTDELRVFVDLDGNGFPASPDVTITGNVNSRWGFNATGTVSTTTGSPVVVVAPSGTTAAGYSTIEIDIPDGTQSIGLKIIANNNTNQEVWVVENIELIGNACPRTYWSAASGDVDDPIWSPFPGGPAGAAIINEVANIVIADGTTVTSIDSVAVNELTIETGAALVFPDSAVMVVHGSSIENNGEMSILSGRLKLVGETPISLTTSSPLDIFDLTFETPAGADFNGVVNIHGSLRIHMGVLDASNATVTLVSDETNTGRIGAMPPATDYIGEITMQRYIPGGATNWRLLGSPVEGATIAQWKDNFLTAGFPGSHFPNFDDPVGSGILWPSIRWYDETYTSPEVNVGMVGVESDQTVLEIGRGYSAWSGDALGGTSPFTIEVIGPPNIGHDPIELPMTWTDSGNPSVDGFNLVSNPLPSPIEFSEIVRGADVADIYYIYDPSTGNNIAWSNGIGQGSADGIIRSSQGFWLKANGPDVTTTVDESAKILMLQGGTFGGDMEVTVPLLSLEITSGLNGFSDQSWIVFENGSAAYDPIDALKLVYAHPEAPQIAVRSSDDREMQIDFRGSYDQTLSIPVTVNVAVSGTYTITAEMINITGLGCLALEDLVTGTLTPLSNGAMYSFEIDAADGSDEPRFIIHGAQPLPFTYQNITCAGDNDGSATVDVGEGSVDVIWMDIFSTPIDEEISVNGEVSISGLEPGNYLVKVIGQEGVCGDRIHEFTISSPLPLEGSATLANEASCQDAEDGQIDLVVMGGTAPYTFEWSNGAETEDLVAIPGEYTVMITDAHGCTWESMPVAIDAGGDAPLASFETGSILVNEPAFFNNTSINGNSYLWDLGDGTISTEVSPTHIYTSPGSYQVTLSVDGASCTATVTSQVVVEVGSSIGNEVEAEQVNAWAGDNSIIIEHPYSGPHQLHVQILDATGKIYTERRQAAVPGRITVPTVEMTSGVWFVRVSHGESENTFRIPLIR